MLADAAARLAAGRADLLVRNKFGMHEAEGRGFRPEIAEALALGLPVILGVNGLNRAAFHAFTDGIGEELPADAGRIADWCALSLADAA